MPSLPPWNWSQRSSTWAVIRPTDAAVALAEEVLGLGVLEERVLVAVEERAALEDQRRHPAACRVQPERQLDEAVRSRRPAPGELRARPFGRHSREPSAHGRLCPDERDASRRPPTSSRRRAPTTARSSSRPPRRPTCSPTSGCSTSEAGPVVEMEGARDDHARLQQLPRPDRRPAGQGGGARGARALRHRAHRLAPPERDDPAARRARTRDRRVDGNRGRDRLHHRLPGQPGHDRDDPRARRHRDLRLGRPRLDPRRLPALGGEAAPLPPQPHGQAREDARARGRGRRRRARGRRRGLLDGGRHLRRCRRSSSCTSATAPG